MSEVSVEAFNATAAAGRSPGALVAPHACGRASLPGQHPDVPAMPRALVHQCWVDVIVYLKFMLRNCWRSC